MENNIKVLINEHDPHDIELLQYQLKKSGINYITQIVQTKDAFEKALCNFKPEIILSDFNLPAFDGLTAFRIKQEIAAETPFIFVSGTIGEENAVELIKSGVTDFVLKERMFQVPSKVIRALTEARARKEKDIIEQQLKHREKQLQKVMDLSLDVICTINQEGDFVTVSSASKQVWGYLPEELIGKKFNDLVYEEDKEYTSKVVTDILRGKTVTNLENRCKHIDGELISIFWSARWDSNDKKMYCVARDATEIKKAEAQLEERTKKISNILESITDGFFSVNTDWNIIYWNKEAEDILGMLREDVLGKNLWDIFQAAIPLRFYKEYHKAMAEKVSVTFSEYFPPMDIWFEVSAYPSEDGLSVYFKDISERLKYIQTIETQNVKLREIAWVQSHIVRAPVARIMGLIDLLNNGSKKEAATSELLTHILTSANELDDVIRIIINKTEQFEKNQNDILKKITD